MIYWKFCVGLGACVLLVGREPGCFLGKAFGFLNMEYSNTTTIMIMIIAKASHTISELVSTFFDSSNPRTFFTAFSTISLNSASVLACCIELDCRFGVVPPLPPPLPPFPPLLVPAGVDAGSFCWPKRPDVS